MIDWRALTKSEGFMSEKAMFTKLYQTLSTSEIARRLSIDPTTVKNRMRKWSVTLRSRGGRNNISKFQLVLYRFDQRWFTTVNCNKLSKYLRISYAVLRAYAQRKENYGVLYNQPSRRPQPIRDDEQDAFGFGTSEE